MSAGHGAPGIKPWAAACAPDTPTFAFSEANGPEVEKILARYPEDRRPSAVIPLLHLAQAQHGGWLPRSALDHIAAMLGMPPIRLCGSDAVLEACKKSLGIDIGETTADGRFFLREFECLGACSNAPVLWVDDDFYEDLDGPKTTAIIEALKRGEQPKPGPQSARHGSEPLGGKTTLLETGE